MKARIGTTDHQKPLNLDVTADLRMLVTANSGGGKSWLLRLIAENAAKHVQTIILDPEGEFVTLRELVDCVIVGKGGDITPDVRSAGLLARRLMELNVSAVVDLSEMKLPVRREFVAAFLTHLIDLPKILWHPAIIMLDEAHLFAPEKSAGESCATESVVGLMSLGRKRGYYGILATQRLAKLRKDAATECTSVAVGRCWLPDDVKRCTEVMGIAHGDRHQFRELEAGEFFGFGPAFGESEIVRFKTGDVQTTHPKAGEHRSIAPPRPSSVVAKVAAELASIPQQAEQEIKDLAAARARIRELEAELKKKPVPAADDAAIEKAVAARDAAWKKSMDSVRSQLDALRAKVLESTERLRDEALKEPSVLAEPAKVAAPQTVLHLRTAAPFERAITVGIDRGSTGEKLPDGERKILTACAQYGYVDRAQLSQLTDYKKSSRDAYVSRLKAKDYVRSDGDHIAITPAGLDALGDFTPLPTGQALFDYYMERLPDGEAACLQAVADAYPGHCDRDYVSGQTGYKKSSRDAYLSRLKARKLITTSPSGLKMADTLAG